MQTRSLQLLSTGNPAATHPLPDELASLARTDFTRLAARSSRCAERGSVILAPGHIRSRYLSMTNDEPAIIDSPLSRTVYRDRISVQVNIFRTEGDPLWAMEVVDETGMSTVWDDLFETGTPAFSVFFHTMLNEGIETFRDHGLLPASATRH